MVRLLIATSIGIHGGGIGSAAGNLYQSVPLAIGLFVSITALVALCAKHTIRRQVSNNEINHSKVTPRSSTMNPKQFLATISNKAIPFIYKKKTGDDIYEIVEKDGGGLWQKGIIMGEKCQPPDFSGVIYYDMDGKQLSEIPPRSPRASPLVTSFSFPVVK